MTLGEIKHSYRMADILQRYGIRTARGMCSCPFHGGDSHPSMKVYRDGYKCFACNAHGDVVDFVRNMEHCDFKTAFAILGGTHEHDTAKMREIEKRRAAKEAEKAKRQYCVQQLHKAITLCRVAKSVFVPYGAEKEMYLLAVHEYPILLGMQEELISGEVVDYERIGERSRECIEKFTV